MENLKITDLSQMTCYECKNIFYVRELPMNLNDPNFCPFCGEKFEQVINIEGDII